MAEMTIAEIAYVHSFVRLRRGPFFRPGHRSRSRRAQGRSRLARLRPPQGLALTGPSTAACWRGTGLHSWLGTCRQAGLSWVGAGDLVAKRGASAASATRLPYFVLPS